MRHNLVRGLQNVVFYRWVKGEGNRNLINAHGVHVEYFAAKNFYPLNTSLFDNFFTRDEIGKFFEIVRNIEGHRERKRQGGVAID